MPRTITCAPSACGEVGNIPSPFRLKDNLKGCGDSSFELACEDNCTVLSLLDGRYHVKSINIWSFWYNGGMEVIDLGLQKGNCSCLPLHPLMPSNFSEEYPFFIAPIYPMVTMMSCSKPVRSPLYINVEPCITLNGYYSYAVINASASEIEEFCTITTSIVTGNYLLYKIEALFGENRKISYNDIHDTLANGFNLSY
ncbi:uncharacterized protein LOC130139179 [Syzygium oleosum]|uniref:uncharacterized protein LOC130139179 n=1 Tax=Syzygium oleosum TaxID=219896 RepID=UPI0024B88459|nr:uncharacterized protein LOC130139179 [Syzygium oleosum]